MPHVDMSHSVETGVWCDCRGAMCGRPSRRNTVEAGHHTRHTARKCRGSVCDCPDPLTWRTADIAAACPASCQSSRRGPPRLPQHRLRTFLARDHPCGHWTQVRNCNTGVSLSDLSATYMAALGRHGHHKTHGSRGTDGCCQPVLLAAVKWMARGTVCAVDAQLRATSVGTLAKPLCAGPCTLRDSPAECHLLNLDAIRART